MVISFLLDIQRYPKNHHCHLADLVSFLISIASKKKVKNWSWFHSQCLPEFTCVWFFIRAKKKWNKFSVLITTLVITNLWSSSSSVVNDWTCFFFVYGARSKWIFFFLRSRKWYICCCEIQVFLFPLLPVLFSVCVCVKHSRI